MRLVGQDWDALTIRERLDVVETIFGDGIPVDRNLDGLAKAIKNAYPSRKEWGLAPDEVAGREAAEREYKRAEALTPEQRAKREARKRARGQTQTTTAQVVGTGHPYGPWLMWEWQKASREQTMRAFADRDASRLHTE